jgi:hypothetical protein
LGHSLTGEEQPVIPREQCIVLGVWRLTCLDADGLRNLTLARNLGMDYLR